MPFVSLAPNLALSWIHFVGDRRELELFGVRLVGFNADTGVKFLLSLCLIVAVILLGALLRLASHVVMPGRKNERVRFWTRQGIRILCALIFLIGLVSVWFNDPTRLTTFLGLVTAGIAFALQRVITAIAGYIVILRGKTFTVGDRIVMGGVRGDVIDLGFIQTRIMEMGQPPSVEGQTDPGMWVKSRQYTGRVVTITNDKLFDEPVYNYTREFPYIWEEMSVPVSYRDDRARAETVLLDAARKHTIDIASLSESAIQEMEKRYVMRRSEMQPRVFWRITDNWLELTVRFVVLDHGVRSVKDAMSRQILSQFDAAHISIASATFAITGVPPLKIQRASAADAR
jgi:small-conductance mechanosensitive channel